MAALDTMPNYRCNFCHRDAHWIWDITFNSGLKRSIGTCEQHREFLVYRLVHLCECGRVSALGYQCVCGKKIPSA